MTPMGVIFQSVFTFHHVSNSDEVFGTHKASNPKTLRTALNNRWNASYVECFEYLKKMLALPTAIVEQRLSIFVIYANAILSAREAAQEARQAESSRLWGQPFTIENILDTLEAALTSPPSDETRIKLRVRSAHSMAQ